MRLILQRVNYAEVEIDGQIAGCCGEGLLIYVGAGHSDTEADAKWLASKAANLRIFEDAEGRMNKSVLDRGGSALVITNFTLMADARKGRRPSFIAAMDPDKAEPLCEKFVQLLAAEGLEVQTGRFGAMMNIRSEAAGPINIIIDSPDKS